MHFELLGSEMVQPQYICFLPTNLYDAGELHVYKFCLGTVSIIIQKIFTFVPGLTYCI